MGASRSEYIRDVLESHQDVDEMRQEHERDMHELRDELEGRIEDLERENKRLQRECRQILEQREQETQLMKYVEEEKSYRQAGLTIRMKYWLFGME